MHEYTMDEELKRCQNVKDYYALCMVFKKSGRGPKNGEQYGAPFREEDWADDDCPDIDNPVMLDIPHKKVDEVHSNSDSRVDAQLLSDDNEDFFKRLLDLLQTNENAFTPSQVVSEEAHSSLLEPTSREIIFPEPVCLLNASGQQCNLQNSFDFTQSPISQLRSHEVAEVTSTPNVYEHKPHATVEEVSDIIPEEDFLEMDDLPVPDEPSQTAVAHLHGNFQLEEFDGLNVSDLFQDAPMFLPDMEPINQPTNFQPYVCSPEQRMASQFDYQFESNSIGERQDSTLQYQQGFVPVNNQLYFDPATQINSQYPHDASQVDNQCQLNGQHQINAQHHLNDQYQINGQHQINSKRQMNFQLHIENQHQINKQLYPHDATEIGNQLWTLDEGRNVFPSAEFSHNSLSEPSSVEGDFLEMDDLPVPDEPSQTAVAHLHGNFQLEELDGLNVSDLFQDAPMFLPDMEPINQPTNFQPYVCSPEQRMASQFDYQFESNSIGERQDSTLQYQQGFVPVNNQLYFDPATQINSQYPHDASQVDNQCQLNGQHQINAQHHLNDQYQINGQHQINSKRQMNFQLHIENQHQINKQSYPHDATQIGNQLWTLDEGRNVFPSAEFSHNSLSEPSSVEEDFPTMDDPLGPVPSQTEEDHLHDNFSLDWLREFDLLPDATVFLPDMELINQPTSSQPCVSLTNVGENEHSYNVF